jgi:Spy/CpxP family protein refolding chaperone
MSIPLKRTMILAAVLLLAAGLPLAAQEAEPPYRGWHGMHGPCGMHGPHGPGYGIGRIMHELDLTADQQDRIHDILDRTMHAELGDAIDVLHKAKRDLALMIHDPAVDETRITEAVRSISELAEETALQQHRMIVEINGVLTEEQQVKARELMEQWTEDPGRFGPRRGPRFGTP